MENILDLSKPFNPQLLDEIVGVFYDSKHPQQAEAGKVLYDLLANDQCWRIADSILENCVDPRSIYYGLMILEDMVKTKWPIVPMEQKESIKSYVISRVMSISETMESVNNNKGVLHKWDTIMVNIFKREWPNSWTSFIGDLINASFESESRCDNNMFIIRLVVEDVYQFSKEDMTSQQSSSLQLSLQNDLLRIYELATQVLTNTCVESLLLDSFEVVRLILRYLPEECVFNYQLCDVLIKYVSVDQFRISALMCLYEVVMNPNSTKYPSLVVQYIARYVNYTMSFLSPDVDLVSNYSQIPYSVTEYIYKSSVFLCNVAKKHMKLLQSSNTALYLSICNYILFLSSFPEQEVLKTCVGFWNAWSNDVYIRYKDIPSNMKDHKQPEGEYSDLVQQVLRFLIYHIGRPEEVMIMESEDGEVIRVENVDTDMVALYKTMKESIGWLCLIDYDIFEAIILEALNYQMSLGQNDAFRDTLQPVVWSIGAASGVLSEQNERTIMMSAVYDLLILIGKKPTKDDKAVVAACLMYIIQQYPRFLKVHYKFLVTVLKKNFEFMHEVHPGVQDMACDTFRKIAKSCGGELLVKHIVDNKEEGPFINEIITYMNVYMERLSVLQCDVFYESICCIIMSERNLNKRNELIQNVMLPFNQNMKQIIEAGMKNNEAFYDSANLQNLRMLLHYNRTICSFLQVFYYNQLIHIFSDMKDLFTLYSQSSNRSIQQQGAISMGYLAIQAQLHIKREVLRIMNAFLEGYKTIDIGEGYIVNIVSVCKEFVPVILSDYEQAPPCAKEPLILQCLALVLQKTQDQCKELIPSILTIVYVSTLQLIMENRLKYNDLCSAFYVLMRGLIKYAFSYVFSFPDEEKRMLIDSVLFGCKDQERSIYEESLDMMVLIINSVRECNDEFKQPFYQSFLVYIIEKVLDVMTDRMHSSILPSLSSLLQLLFRILMSQEVKVPVLPNCTSPYQNAMEVGTVLTQYLCELFPACSTGIVNDYVISISNSYSQSDVEFRTINEDFLIKLKEASNGSI